MKNVEYQDNITKSEEIKIHSKNIKSYTVALELCNKAMKTVGIDNNIPSEKHASIFNLKVYQNGLVALGELLKHPKHKNTENESKELIGGYTCIINLLEQFIRPQSEAKHYYKQGQKLYNSGEYAAALISFEEAININPCSVYYYCQGNTLKKLGKYEEAIVALDKAIKLNPDYIEAYNEKGSALAFLEQHNEAIKFYNKAIKLNPNYAEAYNNKGRSLCELGRYEEAVICFGKAGNLNPNFKLAIVNQTNTVDYLKNRTLQSKTKDFFKMISKIELIGR